MRSFAVILILSILPGSSIFSQSIQPQSQEELCANSNRKNKKVHKCEVSEFTLKNDRNTLVIDAQKNGGIEVFAWNKNEILVQAVKRSWARNESTAEDLLESIAIETIGTITPDLPKSKRNEGASVSFVVYVPRDSNLDLKTFNGGIRIEDVNGDITFQALNGGIKLKDLSGDVRGNTTNGGISVYLNGSSWNGKQLDISTTNGGVNLYVPESYNADLTVGTVNGGMKFDFPVTVQGSFSRRVSAEIGNGGKPVKVVTTNGGVRVKKGLVILRNFKILTP